MLVLRKRKRVGVTLRRHGIDLLESIHELRIPLAEFSLVVRQWLKVSDCLELGNPLPFALFALPSLAVSTGTGSQRQTRVELW